jgi:very-short-patch-repair endonuclease
MRIKGDANLLLEQHLEELGLAFVKEFKFHPVRKWRFDYFLDTWRNERSGVAIEIEGAVWTQGRHTRGSGYVKDLEKYREAAALGFKVFRFSTQEVLSGVAREFIQKHCT